MFSPRTRLAISLTITVVSVLLIALNLDIMPDYRQVAMRGRAQLCEAIAANTTVVVRQRDLRRLEAVLDLVVRRNAEVLSAAVRREDGSLAVEIGNHEQRWRPSETAEPSDTQVMVPIHANNEPWGRVELCFEPLSPPGWTGYIRNRRTLFVGCVGAATFLLANLYLRKTLQQMDPSKVVPGRVRSALDTLAEGLLVLDSHQRIMLANQSFAEIVGQPPERLMGRTASALPWMPRGPDAEIEYPWEMSLRNEAPLSGAMMYLKDVAGKRRSFMVNCTPILGQDGDNRGVLASFEDVTQLEETQHALSRSKEAADAANQAKSDFLARMSHEIRTPMNAILGFTDVLRRGFAADAEERQEYLDTIHASGQHLLNLINDILDLSKVESGRLEVERVNCSPFKIIHEAVTALRGHAERKGILLDYTAPERLPATITTDPVRFRQLLTNLIGNAIKFTETGSVRVIARISRAAGNPQLAIEVLDTGIGIREDSLDKIFDPFVQADNSVTRRFGGTGLGLAISRRFAEALGGRLTVSSKFGAGSVFAFTLDTGPLDGIPLISAEGFRSTLRKTTASETLDGKLPSTHILVVDDGDSNRKLINLVLTRAGAKVQSARNGKEAVERALTTTFDLILMDMQMPVMDGYTATRVLRDKGFDGPIIALTADAMKGTEARCREAGCTGFLTKPIDMDNLIKSLSTTLVQRGFSFNTQCASAEVPDHREHPRAPIHSTLPTDDIEFLEVVVEFEARLREKLSAMHQAMATNDKKTLAALAHWLKGSGGTAGFSRLTDLAKTLERLTREGGDREIADLVAEIQVVAECIVVPDLTTTAPQ
ncbi:MAG: response regulator [Planctomycetes bacterium]|nr:response regulator [Planctomycetota bacterium]